jgi:hypothetical protein
MPSGPIRAILALVLFAALAAPAHAARPVRIGTGSNPAVAVDAAGTAHVAFNGEYASGTGEPLMYCTWPRGAKTCAPRPIVTDGQAPSDTPPLVQTGPGPGDVTLVSGRSNIQVFRSADAGASFAPPYPIGSGRWFAGAFGPGGQLALSFRNLGYIEYYPRNLGGPVDTGPAIELAQGYDVSSAVGFAGNLPVLVSGAFVPGIAVSSWTGQGDIRDPATWAGPFKVAHADYFGLASGKRGLWLAHNTPVGSEDRIVARKFNGRRFGKVHRVPAGRHGLTGVINLGFAQDSAGHMVVAWYASPFHRIEVSASRTGNHWTPATVLATGVSLPSDIRVGLGSDGRGLVVWDDNGDDNVNAVRVSAPALLRGH